MATSRFTAQQPAAKSKPAPRTRVKPTVVDVDAKVVEDSGIESVRVKRPGSNEFETVFEQPKAEPEATPFERLHQRIHSAYSEFVAETDGAGPKQRIAAWVLGALTAFGLGYLGGWFSSVMLIAALAVTGSMFLGIVAYLIGVLITLYTSTIAGVAVTEWVNSIKPRALAGRVRGFFNRNNVEAAHA